MVSLLFTERLKLGPREFPTLDQNQLELWEFMGSVSFCITLETRENKEGRKRFNAER